MIPGAEPTVYEEVPDLDKLTVRKRCCRRLMWMTRDYSKSCQENVFEIGGVFSTNPYQASLRLGWVRFTGFSNSNYRILYCHHLSAKHATQSRSNASSGFLAHTYKTSLPSII